MKLTILGNNSQLWQWDTGQKLIVEDDDGMCNEVHFCNEYSEEALVLPIIDQDDLRVVNIPNILLQEASPLKAYLYHYDSKSSETLYIARFPIKKRLKPESYTYTETEVLNYAYLDERLKDLEGEGLANAVADYLKENPVEAGATAEEAKQIQQNKEDIEQLSQDKLDAAKLPEAVNDALAQAKASGDFKGEKGDPGEPGKTPEKGKDYFTDADKQEIAELAADMVEVPSGGSNQPLTFTGAVNATYDGSKAVSVEIPQGGGGGGSAEWELINTFILEEDSNSVIIDKDSNGNSFDLSAFMLYIDRVASDLQTANGTLYIGNAPNGYFGRMHDQTASQTRIWMSGEFMTGHMFSSASGNTANGNFSAVISYAGGHPTSAPMIRLYGYYFGAGTKITFYGVRK